MRREMEPSVKKQQSGLRLYKIGGCHDLDLNHLEASGQKSLLPLLKGRIGCVHHLHSVLRRISLTSYGAGEGGQNESSRQDGGSSIPTGGRKQTQTVELTKAGNHAWSGATHRISLLGTSMPRNR